MPSPSRRRILATIAVVFAALAGSTSPTTARPPASTQLAPMSPDFLWGVAASGFQAEGDAPDSNWRRYAESGSTEHPYLNSVDFRQRFRSDIELAADLGVRVYRIGIEWARVQPRPGVWDEAGLRFYDEVVGAIVAAGMRPMLTLDHWVYPGWVADRGGWRDPRIVADWLTNARSIVDRFAHTDPLWVTFNEPMVYLANELRHGGLAPADAPSMVDRIAQAHNGIHEYIHSVQPGAMVTSNVAHLPAVDDAVNGPLLDRISARLDYIGIDYYYSFSPAEPRIPDPGKLWTMPLHPEGIYYVLEHYARKFPGRPLYIVENGMPTENGLPRPDGYTRADSLRDTVYWLQRAVADGIPLLGYNYWSLTDNYEWGSYTPRFGLYTVDVLTDPALTRKPTDAVAAYREITAAGGVGDDYRPTRAPAPCSVVNGVASCTDPVTVPR